MHSVLCHHLYEEHFKIFSLQCEWVTWVFAAPVLRVVWFSGHLLVQNEWQSIFDVPAPTLLHTQFSDTHRSLVFCGHLRSFVSIAGSTTVGPVVCVFGWMCWLQSSRLVAYSCVSHSSYIIMDEIKADKKKCTLEVSDEAEKATSGLKGNSAASSCLPSNRKCLMLVGY